MSEIGEYTFAQGEQLGRLRLEGWRFEIIGREPEPQVLFVRALDPFGYELVGHLTAEGAVLLVPADRTMAGTWIAIAPLHFPELAEVFA